MAHPRHEDVRRRFGGRCGYCGVSEGESGGELTVDHFHSQAAGGDDTDDNLVYACFRCNLYKADFVPSADDFSRGRWLLQPLRDDPTQHYRANPHTGELEPLTETGRFHITLLHLNRPALVTYRLRERLRTLELARLRTLEEEIEHLRHLVAAQAEPQAVPAEAVRPIEVFRRLELGSQVVQVDAEASGVHGRPCAARGSRRKEGRNEGAVRS